MSEPLPRRIQEHPATTWGAMISGSLSMLRGARKEGMQPPVPEEVCRGHLKRVASSATFARAQQLRRLLEWLGERSLSRDNTPPTEKEIGEIVLRREDFDPQTDSLVRKEMSRLREKLTQYYAREGAREHVRILSAGGYLFRFAWSELSASEAAGFGDSPTMLVLPVRSHPDLASQSVRFLEELLVSLGEQGGVQLVSPTTALSYAGRLGDVREFAAECGADVVLEGSLDFVDGKLRVTLWLVDGRSGRTEYPGRFSGAELEDLVKPAASWLRSQYLSES